MHKLLTDIPLEQSLDLQIGPLRYRLLAHDEWGRKILQGIAAHLSCEATTQSPDRIIYLQHEGNRLPQSRTLSPLSSSLAGEGWHQLESQLDAVWLSPRTSRTFWTPAFVNEQFTFRFHLPWGLIIHDMIARSGGLIHGGLASYHDSGFLFLAPPGGGKSTILRTAPSNWRVFSDDAALVWPEGNGCWRASPLPAWGNMIRPDEDWLYPGLDLGHSCKLEGQILLQKTEEIELQRLHAKEVVPASYRALSEYPAAVMAETGAREALFRMAAQMSRDISCWRLSLPKHADIWPLLAEEAA